eukprot:TRINITY_DN19449_c0_g1_i1.p1 TRINITY_DN19449_c0_g1~~TRINITY_DN19449_c0_g1_i1.p1  ORF type:complete len:635 (-),score=88.45 TRINITY_DN19449_c0_g1_i1:300-2033(-)
MIAGSGVVLPADSAAPGEPWPDVSKGLCSNAGGRPARMVLHLQRYIDRLADSDHFRGKLVAVSKTNLEEYLMGVQFCVPVACSRSLSLQRDDLQRLVTVYIACMTEGHCQYATDMEAPVWHDELELSFVNGGDAGGDDVEVGDGDALEDLLGATAEEVESRCHSALSEDLFQWFALSGVSGDASSSEPRELTTLRWKKQHDCAAKGGVNFDVHFNVDTFTRRRLESEVRPAVRQALLAMKHQFSILGNTSSSSKMNNDSETNKVIGLCVPSSCDLNVSTDAELTGAILAYLTYAVGDETNFQDLLSLAPPILIDEVNVTMLAIGSSSSSSSSSSSANHSSQTCSSSSCLEEPSAPEPNHSIEEDPQDSRRLPEWLFCHNFDGRSGQFWEPFARSVARFVEVPEATSLDLEIVRASDDLVRAYERETKQWAALALLYTQNDCGNEVTHIFDQHPLSQHLFESSELWKLDYSFCPINAIAALIFRAAAFVASPLPRSAGIDINMARAMLGGCFEMTVEAARDCAVALLEEPFFQRWPPRRAEEQRKRYAAEGHGNCTDKLLLAAIPLVLRHVLQGLPPR